MYRFVTESSDTCLHLGAGINSESGNSVYGSATALPTGWAVPMIGGYRVYRR